MIFFEILNSLITHQLTTGHKRYRHDRTKKINISPNISKRPSNILKVRSSFPKSGIDAKLDSEPTTPNPGPAVLIVAADAEKAVMISTPIVVISKPFTNRIRIYSTINRRTECTVSSSIGFPSILSGITACGCCNFLPVVAYS